MMKIYSVLALFLVLALISTGSALARDGEGLAGNASSSFSANYNNEMGPARAEDFAMMGMDARTVSRLTAYRQDDPVNSGENARVLAMGPFPEAMEKSYNEGTMIGSFLSTESEGWVRANPELGEYGPNMRVGTAF